MIKTNQISGVRNYKVNTKNGIDDLYCTRSNLKFGDSKKFPKRILFDYLRELSKKGLFKSVKDIIVWKGKNTEIELNLLIKSYNLHSNISEQICTKSYEFRGKDALHFYANHAAQRLGGGIVSKGDSGFVQEEKCTYRFSLIAPLAYKQLNDKLEYFDTNLGEIPLLIKTNVLLHEIFDGNFYGKLGLKMLADNPTTINKYYREHNTKPRIYWLCKAIPIIQRKNGEDYSKLYKNYAIIEWSLFLCYKAYCLAIQTGETEKKINEITIHDGNWGCGAFGHNLNTIYVIEHMAINMAVQTMIPKKKVNFIYHTYDDQTKFKLKIGIDFWQQNRLKPYVQIFRYLKDFLIEKNPNWSDHL